MFLKSPTRYSTRSTVGIFESNETYSQTTTASPIDARQTAGPKSTMALPLRTHFVEVLRHLRPVKPCCRSNKRVEKLHKCRHDCAMVVLLDNKQKGSRSSRLCVFLVCCSRSLPCLRQRRRSDERLRGGTRWRCDQIARRKTESTKERRRDDEARTRGHRAKMKSWSNKSIPPPPSIFVASDLRLGLHIKPHLSSS
jgi:hypothetical protein